MKSKELVTSEDDSEVVALMRKSGAIPICLTEATDLGFWFETSNSSWNRAANNPYR